MSEPMSHGLRGGLAERPGPAFGETEARNMEG